MNKCLAVMREGYLPELGFEILARCLATIGLLKDYFERLRHGPYKPYGQRRTLEALRL